MGELETKVRELFGAFERQEFDSLRQMVTADVQGVDELSRRWMRDVGEIDAYFKQLEGAVTEINSTLSDLREDDWDETGVVTCWLEQDYTLNGEPQHVSAPSTFVLRRVEGEWKIALIHTIPLPDEA